MLADGLNLLLFDGLKRQRYVSEHLKERKDPSKSYSGKLLAGLTLWPGGIAAHDHPLELNLREKENKIATQVEISAKMNTRAYRNSSAGSGNLRDGNLAVDVDGSTDVQWQFFAELAVYVQDDTLAVDSKVDLVPFFIKHLSNQ